LDTETRDFLVKVGGFVASIFLPSLRVKNTDCVKNEFVSAAREKRQWELGYRECCKRQGAA
jgi:hypothetical protein